MADSYDLILIDTAPILAAADSLVIGAHAGAIYIITRAGITTQAEIKESLNRLRQSGLVAKGVLFNDQKPHTGGYNYQYEYGNYGEATNREKINALLEAPSGAR